MKPRALLLASLTCITMLNAGGIEKIAVPSDEGLKLYWWPKVEAPIGFEFDQAASYYWGVKMFIQKGSTLASADTVIYAKAIYKPRSPETTSLKQLINDDLDEFKQRDPHLSISVVQGVTNGDGEKLQCYSFIPSTTDGNWESVAYGEEGDFYLLFTISARSQNGFETALPLFQTMVKTYHK